MRTISMGLFMLLFAVSVQAAGSSSARPKPASVATSGSPVLALKSRTTIDRKDVFTISLSFVDASVLKALNAIHELNRVGSYVAYEFLSFEIDEAAKQVRVSTAAGTADERQLLSYLQKSLDMSLSGR